MCSWAGQWLSVVLPLHRLLPQRSGVNLSTVGVSGPPLTVTELDLNLERHGMDDMSLTQVTFSFKPPDQ